MFSSVSWLLLFGGMISLTMVVRQVYESHLAPQAVQRFSFGAYDTGATSNNADLSEVTRQHIFGVVPPVKKPVVEKPKAVEAPKTQLKLSLTGVITANTPSESRAMVEIKRGQTSVVKVGEEIGKTGATLTEVFNDHILIEHRGKPEKLEIVRPKMSITDIQLQSEQTISALNINVAEFEALAKVDPSDLDISKLLPIPAPPVQQTNEEEVGQGAPAQSNQGAVGELTLRQIQELEDLDRREEIDELQRILDDGGLEQSEMEELRNELILLRTQ